MAACYSSSPVRPADPRILPAILADPIFQIDVPTGTPEGPVEGSGGSNQGGPWSSPDIAFRWWDVSEPTQANFAVVLREANELGMKFNSLACLHPPTGVDFIAGGQKTMQGYAGYVVIGLQGGRLEVSVEISPEDPYPHPNYYPNLKRVYDDSCLKVVEEATGFSGKKT